MRRAVEHCLSTQRDDGAWEADPDPRIAETALAAIALGRVPGESADAAGAAAERARRWLRRAVPQAHHPAAEAFESALCSLALGDGDAPIDVGHTAFTDPVLSSRARLLQVVALSVGRPVVGGPDVADLRAGVAKLCAADGPIKRWSRVELLSAHALLESSNGVHRIAAEQSANGGFFDNPVSSALACLALLSTPHTAWEAQRCADYLLSRQFPDGTWRFCSSDVWDTTLTIRALRGVSVFDRSALPQALDFLLQTQNEDGGWPFRSGVESDNDTTAAALLALAGSTSVPGDAVPHDVVSRAVKYLARQQMPDGLWRTWQSAGDPPVEDVVAHVVAALDAHRGHHGVPVAPARAWLIERHKQHGRWNAGWYHGVAYAAAEVIPALAADDRPTAQAATKELIRAQNPDGGWSAHPGSASCPGSTGLALAALAWAGVRDERSQAAGVDHLLDMQRDDGSWAGTALMYGPRPLLTHYQTHTQAFALMGLRAASEGEH